MKAREPLHDSRPSHATRHGLLARLHLDSPLSFGLVTASVLGFVVLFSASQDPELLTKQAIRVGLGFMVMFAVAQVPPSRMQTWAPGLFVIGVLMLTAVLLLGEVGKGARRWLDLGLVSFQPSELMKISLPLVLAWYLGRQGIPPSLPRIATSMLLIIVPVSLVLAQPDLGTALVVGSSGTFVLFLGGIRWWIMGTMVGILALAAPAFWQWGMLEYQRQRVLTLLNPESDPLGAGYHIIQSKIAIGSGGTYGKGWLNGTQAKLDFLPESSTDFVFAVFAEEFGLYGGVALLALFLFVIARGIYIAIHAQDTFGRLLAGSLSLTFFVYVFVNIGMVVGLLPVVGLPLPLISYGGTSLVTLMAGFGILMSIHTHRRLVPR